MSKPTTNELWELAAKLAEADSEDHEDDEAKQAISTLIEKNKTKPLAISEDHELRHNLTVLRQQRDAHQMDESDYIDAVMALIEKERAEARFDEQENHTTMGSGNVGCQGCHNGVMANADRIEDLRTYLATLKGDKETKPQTRGKHIDRGPGFTHTEDDECACLEPDAKEEMICCDRPHHTEPDHKPTNKEVVAYINANYDEVMHVLRANHHYHIEYYVKWSLTWLAIAAMWLIPLGIVIVLTGIIMGVVL